MFLNVSVTTYHISYNSCFICCLVLAAPTYRINHLLESATPITLVRPYQVNLSFSNPYQVLLSLSCISYSSKVLLSAYLIIYQVALSAITWSNSACTCIKLLSSICISHFYHLRVSANPIKYLSQVFPSATSL